MISTELNLCINDDEWITALPDYEKLSSKIVKLAVNHAETHNPSMLSELQKTLSFNLCLSNNDEVRALNKEFRDKDKPTNVLSFANIDDCDFKDIIQQTSVVEMGDIIIALQTMQQESSEKKISLHNHFCHLLTHGVLHLLGYDHIDDEEADLMERLEIEILQKLNIDNPYKE